MDKKLDGDRRGMSDYNGEMRRGGRGGAGGYRMPSSKEPGDMGPYGDKVRERKEQRGETHNSSRAQHKLDSFSRPWSLKDHVGPPFCEAHRVAFWYEMRHINKV